MTEHTPISLTAAEEVAKLRGAIQAAGFAVMQTSGRWSIHDVSEKGKADETRELKVATENVRLQIQRDDLLTACKAFVQAAKDAHEHWDADRDMKVGKLLCAMAGYLDGYRAELTAAHAAIAKAERQS